MARLEDEVARLRLLTEDSSTDRTQLLESRLEDAVAMKARYEKDFTDTLAKCVSATLSRVMYMVSDLAMVRLKEVEPELADTKQKVRAAEAQMLSLRQENKMTIERLALSEKALERLRNDLASATTERDELREKSDLLGTAHAQLQGEMLVLKQQCTTSDAGEWCRLADGFMNIVQWR